MPERRFLKEGRLSYKRRINQFEPRQQFLIVCEGAKTEPNYFKKFPIPPDSVVDVEGPGANTDGLVKEAILLMKKKKYDQVWVVFDRDSFTPQHFNNAIQLAKNNGIRVAYSNEAFELWYFLHFHYLEAGITRDDYCHRLGQADCLGHKYDKKSEDIYDELSGKQSIAIRNANK
ncbi:MAG: RloB family protein [Anaerolineales bacterium]|jgi:hypothetical protein